MSATPTGFATLGPYIVTDKTKKAFVDLCRDEGKRIDTKIKEMVIIEIRKKMPDFVDEGSIRITGKPVL